MRLSGNHFFVAPLQGAHIWGLVTRVTQTFALNILAPSARQLGLLNKILLFLLGLLDLVFNEFFDVVAELGIVEQFLQYGECCWAINRV